MPSMPRLFHQSGLEVLRGAAWRFERSGIAFVASFPSSAASSLLKVYKHRFEDKHIVLCYVLPRNSAATGRTYIQIKYTTVDPYSNGLHPHHPGHLGLVMFQSMRAAASVMFLVFLIVTYPTLRLGFKNTCAHTRALASLYNLFLGAILGHIKYASDYNLQPVINVSLHQPVVSLGSEQYIPGNPTSIFPTTWRISKRQERVQEDETCSNSDNPRTASHRLDGQP